MVFIVHKRLHRGATPLMPSAKNISAHRSTFDASMQESKNNQRKTQVMGQLSARHQLRPVRLMKPKYTLEV